jgi:hypothetical protein
VIDGAVARWFAERRGITVETLEAFGVTTEGEELVTFPYGTARKMRKGLEKEGRKFWWNPPTAAGQVPFLPPGFEPGKWMFLTEGESDTLALWQAAPEEFRSGIVGLSGASSFKERYAEELFAEASKVFVLFDRDDPYEAPDAAKNTAKAWQKVQAALGRKARRVILPQGINDVAEFFQQYDWAALAVLLRKAAEPVRHYPRLDLSRPVPDTDWLIEDLLVCEEASVLAGNGGVGKSFITMALALAVAGEDSHFLGLPIKKHGPVLYVDEENSAALVLQRLNALGLTPAQRANIDYLWYAGVDIFNEPEKLLEEALDLEPVLVVLDSLSRISIGAEENSNTDMTKLMRLGLIPIARDTGAAVLLTHHTDKEEVGPRGASAIRNAADQVISVKAAIDKRSALTGVLNIFPSKPRRQTSHISARIVGDVEKEGWARVEEAKEEEPF